MKSNTKDRIDVVLGSMKIEQGVGAAYHEFHAFMKQRKGQALMNALRHMAPDLYEIISGSPEDCFYNDEKMSSTLAALGFKHKIFFQE